MEQMNIFDLLGNEEKDKFKVFESTDWKQNKWIVNFDNGVKLGTIDLKCPKCGYCVICPKVDVPNFCGKCGMKLER